MDEVIAIGGKTTRTQNNSLVIPSGFDDRLFRINNPDGVINTSENNTLQLDNSVYDQISIHGISLQPHKLFTPLSETEVAYASVGEKLYEIKDHLGNVRAVVTDRKLGVDNNNDGVVDQYQADVVSLTDYYPFGMEIPGRTYSGEEYSFGFQGQEMDDEIKGEGNSVNYKYRMHDPRIGRFFARDPLAAKYPYNSPYAFSENRVIDGVELEGLEVSLVGVAPNIPAIQLTSSEIIQTASFTDFGDAAVLATILTRGWENAINIDGSKANNVDKWFAIGGAFVPYVSGSLIHKVIFGTELLMEVAIRSYRFAGFGGDIIVKATKNTAVLGRYESAIKELKEGGLFHDQKLKFLNIDDETIQAAKDIATAEGRKFDFFEDINKKFLDEIIENGDEIRLVSDPGKLENIYLDVNDFSKGKTTFGKEIDYLKSKGYEIDGNKMIKL